MTDFKTELLVLLKKYPLVKNVTFDITQTLSLKDEVVPREVVAEEKPAYVSPHAQALTAAEQTIASLSQRAGIKIQKE